VDQQAQRVLQAQQDLKDGLDQQAQQGQMVQLAQQVLKDGLGQRAQLGQRVQLAQLGLPVKVELQQ
jgi:hypothetical protein